MGSRKFKDGCGIQDKIKQTMEISKVRPDQHILSSSQLTGSDASNHLLRGIISRTGLRSFPEDKR